MLRIRCPVDPSGVAPAKGAVSNKALRSNGFDQAEITLAGWLPGFSVLPDQPIYVYALVIGALICASGLTVTVRFVLEHPKVAHG